MAKRDTIFISIASYRDKELKPTIEDCLKQAKYPDRLVFTICWQHSKEDKWDNLDKYKNDRRFNIIDIDYKDSKGACWARHQIQKFYNDETYTLQLDSHHRFITNWDEECIKMHKLAIKQGYPKPLLTSYIASYFPDKDPKGRLEEVWYLCFDRIAPQGPLHTKPHTLEDWKTLEGPVPNRFFSGHFAFTTGDFNVKVPYDPALYFHGEEITMAVRAYTHGYDLLTPHKVLAYHYYERDDGVKHWSDHDFKLRDEVSFSRVRTLLGVGKPKCRPCVLKQLEPYALGKERTIVEYEQYAGIDFTTKRIQQHTLDNFNPPNPTNFDTVDGYSNSFLKYNKYAVDVHSSHFNEDDYEYCVISFEGKEPEDIVFREDIDGKELIKMIKDAKDGFLTIWKEFYGEPPYKVVVWPYSKKEGFVERYEKILNEE